MDPSGVGDAERRYDAVVIGGGPAGAGAARALAAWGHRVALLVGPAPQRPALVESLPPSARKPLAALEMLEIVDGAGFAPTRGNTASWAGAPLRAIDFGAEETGLQVERARLDPLLRGAAAAAGADVIDGAAREVALRTDSGEDWSVVRWTGAEGGGLCRTRWVLDCTGRSGVVAARRGLRRRQPGPATIALIGDWRRGRWGLADPSHTLVESYLDGWAWSVATCSEHRHVATMVDPRATALTRGGGVERMYHAELAKTRHHRPLLDGARLVGAPWACAATPYGAHRHAEPGLLLVGDAGSFLDPLSSFGVKKALASAWLAAVVVNTAIRNPTMEGPALALFEERERAAYDSYAELTARYYAAAAEHHRHPFWVARAEGTMAAPGVHSRTATDSERILSDPRLPAAFAALRVSSDLRLRASRELRREWLPAVRDREVILQEYVVSPAVPGGIRVVRGVELPRLVNLLDRHRGVPELYEALLREQAPVGLPDFLSALSVLVALELVSVADA